LSVRYAILPGDVCSSTLEFSPDWVRAAGLWPINLDSDPTLRRSYDLLRGKWGTVPFRQYERCRSAELLKQNDEEILATWTDAYVSSSTGAAYSARGWYQTLYTDAFHGKKILDFGCGLAPDCVMWAERAGARVTFVDIVETNVRFVERVCRFKGVHADFVYWKICGHWNHCRRISTSSIAAGRFITRRSKWRKWKHRPSCITCRLAVGGFNWRIPNRDGNSMGGCSRMNGV